MLIPDHETAVDLLNYQAISMTITKLLSGNRKSPVTIGVHGSWGAGKSSVLKMIEDGLSHDQGVFCLWFNGWAFQGFDDAKTVLIETIVEEIQRKRSKTEKVKNIAVDLLKKVDWLKTAKKLSGYAVSTSLAGGLMEVPNVISLSDQDSPSSVPEAMHQFRGEFETLLREANITQLIILIDDLDRCLPKTAIETLEAIRLFLFVPKSAFIVAADEAMIEYSVKQHFPDLPTTREPTSYARNYLEKLIQVPFRIPSMGSQETKTYVTLLLVQNLVGEEHAGFKALLSEAKKGMARPWDAAPLKLEDVESVEIEKKNDLTQAYALGQRIGERLAEGTRGNPRQIKRFLNSMLLRSAIADALGFGGNIKQDVLAKLMLAEMYHSDFYEEISVAVMQSFDGTLADLKWLESNHDVDEKASAKKAKNKQDNLEIPERIAKWLEKDQLKTWAKIDPPLWEVDLRPYVFVARDKRLIIANGAGLNALDELKKRLCKNPVSARGAEADMKSLYPVDAERLFNDLREIVISGNTATEPKAFEGLRLIAKHHTVHQSDLLEILENLRVSELGPWVVKGWGGVLRTEEASHKLDILLDKWSNQDEQSLLKNAAKDTLSSRRSI